MDVLGGLELGLLTSLTLQNLAFCFIGTLLGTLVGVLPGIGPATTIALLLPITFELPMVGALIMLAGIYYGAQYGGSTTAILVNMPGESSGIVTALDGHQMARQGRAGVALTIAALGSFFAGTVSTFFIALLSPALSDFGLLFGPAENVALMVLGIVAVVVMSKGSVLNALAMVMAGFLLGMIGTDVNTSQARFTFGIQGLRDGISFVPLAIGLFGVSEILRTLENRETARVLDNRIASLRPSRQDLRDSALPVVRGTALGALLGILPGSGTLMASFSSYLLEKKLARDPSRFGKGAIEGLAAPESANNAAAQTSFVPMLTLGLPSGSVTALMIGAMTIHGVSPGPQLMVSHPDLFWGVICSMWIGNAMLLIINLPLIGVWVQVLRIPYRRLVPAIIVFCCVGAYCVNNSSLDVAVLLVAGVAGYLLSRLGCEPTPLLLAFILGPMLEENLRRMLRVSHGDPAMLLQQPISMALLGAASLLLLATALPAIRRRRREVFTDGDA